MTNEDLQEVARLAGLDHIDYARERAAAAAAMGIGVTALDKEVNAAKASLGLGAGAGGPGASKPIVLSEIIPWPTTVDGIVLLGALIDLIGRYVIIGEQQKLIVALWIIHCFVIEATSITPRLAITSVFPESGKTTLLKVIRYLAPRPLHLVALTGPVLFRMIEVHKPTMLLDEGNNWLFNNSSGGGNDTKGDIMAIIDAGHERGVIVPRLVPSGNGSGDFVPHGFNPYGPLALALNGKLPEQIDSRSIEIPCTRRDANQTIAPLYARRPPPELADMARQLARYGADHNDLLAEWEPDIPTEISNRTADNWEFFLRISEVIESEAVGPKSSRPDYPALTREAAIAAGKASKANRMTSNTRLTLLTDLKWLFGTEWEMDQKPAGPNQFSTEAEVTMFSADIVEALAELEDRPWAEWGRRRQPISKVALARLLNPLKILPRNIRRGNQQQKGYAREQFEAAWRIYV